MTTPTPPYQPYPTQPQNGQPTYPQPLGTQAPYQQQPPAYGQPPHIPQQRGLPTPPPAAKKKRRRWPWVVLAVLVLFIIVVSTGSKGGTPAPTSGAPASAAVTPNAVTPAAPAVPAPAAPAPAAPAASAPTSYTGRGDDVVTIKKDDGPAIVTFECAKCSANTVLQSDGGDSLLVNTIGSYSGRRLIDATDGSTTSTLTVKATGSWKITVASGLASATKGGTSVSGHGDDVAVLTGNISKAAITNKGGSSNFVVQVYGSSGFPDLAVNTIGGYSGTVPIETPAALAITSTGSWSVTGS